MVLRLLRCESEVTQMCTSGDEGILIVGTVLGSINLYDLNEFDSASSRLEELDYEALFNAFYPELAQRGTESEEYYEKMQQVRSRYSVQWPTFSTDGLPNYSHYSPIRKLVFISKIGNASAQIGVLDELLTISTWSLIEIQPQVAERLNDFDLSMRIGGRFKLLENFSENLMYLPELSEH